ncbi:hypothetical protein AgCh_016953 [Apium graveolens]
MASPPSSNRIDSKKTSYGGRSSPYGSRDGAKSNSATANLKKQGKSDDIRVVLNPLYQSEVHGLNADGEEVSGLVRDSVEESCGFQKEVVSSELDRSDSKVTVVSQSSVVKDVVKVFEEMPLRNPGENWTEGVIGGHLGGNVNIPVDSSSHALESEMDAHGVFDNMQNRKVGVESNEMVDGGDLGGQSDSISGLVNQNGSPKMSMDDAYVVFMDVPDQKFDGIARTGVSGVQMGGGQNLSSGLKGGFSQNVNWKREQEAGVVSPNSKTGGESKQWLEIVRPKEGYARMKFEYHAPEVVEGKHIAMRKWAKRGLDAVIMNSEGFFFFKFASENELLEVLEEGVCLIEGKPLVLQRWYPQIELSKEVPKFIPIWVKIYNIPLQYWNKEGLSGIGSGVGNILMADSLNGQMCRQASGRLSFAKLLIEVDAMNPLPDSLFVLIPHEDGRDPVEVILKVEYPWRPSWCTKCKKFGHSLHGCPVLAVERDLEQLKVRDSSKGVNKVSDQEAGFTVVQRKGKEAMVEGRGLGKQGKNYGVSVKRPIRVASPGIVIRDYNDKNFSKDVNPVIGKNKSGASRNLIVGKNRFDLLSDINKSDLQTSCNKGLLPTPGVESQFLQSGRSVLGLNLLDKGPNASQKGGSWGDQNNLNDMVVDKSQTMGELWNDRVKSYVCSGSNVTEVEKAELDKKITEKELHQINGFLDELEVCRTNQEQEFCMDPDETDSFMMQGIVRDRSEIGDGEESHLADSVD